MPKPIHTFIDDVTTLQPHIQWTKPKRSMIDEVMLYGFGLTSEGKRATAPTFGNQAPPETDDDGPEL